MERKQASCGLKCATCVWQGEETTFLEYVSMCYTTRCNCLIVTICHWAMCLWF